MQSFICSDVQHSYNEYLTEIPTKPHASGPGPASERLPTSSKQPAEDTIDKEGAKKENANKDLGEIASYVYIRSSNNS
jgi:hypothetical protein